MTSAETSQRFRIVALLALAELFAMSLWFGVSAVAPTIEEIWHVSPRSSAWLTLAVQVGFVAGTLASALLNLPDVMSPRTLLAISALAGALVNASLALFADSIGVAIALRFLTGVSLAGVYPPGMKLVATWFREGRGLALGFLIGALTLGKGVPYLLNAAGGANWRVKALIPSVLASLAAVIVYRFVREGPFSLGRAPFDLSQVRQVFSNRAVRLANFGYFGHMWELYAMWTWAPVMLRAAAEARGSGARLAELSSFLVIGSGAAGCVIAGNLADRYGRTIVTSWAMAISGLCCIVIGFLMNAPPLLLLAVAIVWGASVVADSAQFSACVTELSDPRYVGTALTVQTCVGFFLTILSIRMMPAAVEALTWRYAFILLAPGPLFGVVSMLRLRSLPEAARIAQGRR